MQYSNRKYEESGGVSRQSRMKTFTARVDPRKFSDRKIIRGRDSLIISVSVELIDLRKVVTHLEFRELILILSANE